MERSRRVDAVAYSAIGLYAAWLGWRLPANVLGDDAAITFRYVVRAVAGHGLTYNDHEHVLGLSNPLYALTLTVLTWLGADVESAARGTGVVLLAVAAILAAALSRRLSGSLLGLVSGFLLPTTYFFRYQAMSGMESVLAACLGLATVLALFEERTVWAGVFLGLAVWNKFDASLLALAIGASWAVVWHRLPIRLALVSTVVVAPWMIFAWWYYGSPVPHSFVAKVAEGEKHAMNHYWVAQFYQWERRWALVLLAAASFVLLWPRWMPRTRLAALTLGLWFVFHAVALSFFNLGDYYPWYLTVLIPPVVILATAVPGGLVGSLSTAPSRTVRLALGGAAIAVLLWIALFQVRLTYGDLASGNPVRPWEAFDTDRRLAGIFLSQFSDPQEVVQSGFGWTAFEIPNAFNDDSQLNTEKLRAPVAYLVYSGAPYQTGSVPPRPTEGFVPVAAFNLASDMFPGYTWFEVFAAPTSVIARSSTRLLQRRLFELPRPTPYAPELGVEHVIFSGLDVVAEPPSGATFTVDTGGQPATLTFSPALAADAAKTSSVTFRVARADGAIAYEQRVIASEHVDPVAVRVSDGTSRILSFSLVTAVHDPAEGSSPTGARWGSAKITIGDARLDLSRVRNDKLIQTWQHFNPPPGVVR